MRTIRRARGLAPSAHRMPPGLESAPAFVACGAGPAAAIASGQGREVVVSPPSAGQHDGTFAPQIELYVERPAAIVVDRDRRDPAGQWGRAKATADRVALIEVQRHHAHVAAVMAEHGYPMGGPPVLGIVLGGLAEGDDGRMWGGEMMLAHYAGYVRTGTFKPLALLGGPLACREPWRCLDSSLRSAMSDAELKMSFGDLPIVQRVLQRRTPELERTWGDRSRSPVVTSAARLFDAVAASVDICFDQQAYDGHAAAGLEAAIAPEDLAEAAAGERYPIGLPTDPERHLPYIETRGMWAAILGDLYAETRPGLISARFHVALAEGMVRMAESIRKREGQLETVVLGGAGWLDRHLFEWTTRQLERVGFRVLTPVRFPAHDGGIALGQAAIAAARMTR